MSKKLAYKINNNLLNPWKSVTAVTDRIAYDDILIDFMA